MSGINDPYAQILGTESPYDQAALDYYGNMPQLRTPYLQGAPSFDPRVEFQNRVRSAFQADVASRIQKIDPLADDYEIQLNETIAGIPDLEAYPQLATAVNSAVGRRKIIQEKRQQEIASQVSLAKLGLSPGEIAQIRDEKGQFDPVRAAYKEYQLKSGKPAERMPLSEKERETMVPIINQLRLGNFSDDEKALAYAKANGVAVDPEMDPEGFNSFKEGLTKEQWTSANDLRKQEVQGQATSLIDVLEATGRETKGLRALLGSGSTKVDPWEATRSPSMTSPAPVAQANPASAPPAVKPDTQGYTDPEDPNISMLQADKARFENERKAKETQDNAGANQQWTQGKVALEKRLLGVFENDPNKLRQFYNSVKNQETVVKEGGPKTGSSMDQESITDSVLRKLGLQGFENSSDIPLDRGFFGGGKVSNRDLLNALVDDRLREQKTGEGVRKLSSGVEIRPAK